jgi:hypothetical protein
MHFVDLHGAGAEAQRVQKLNMTRLAPPRSVLEGKERPCRPHAEGSRSDRGVSTLAKSYQMMVNSSLIYEPRQPFCSVS